MISLLDSVLDQLWKANRDILFKSWFLVPAGVVIMLLLIMGVDLLIGLTGISFPASVLSATESID